MSGARLRAGVARSGQRRTIVDDRTGVVLDISQAGTDDNPHTYVEIYPWPAGQRVDVTLVDDVGLPHPYLVVRVVPRERA